jgi:hypothetical protein
VTRFPRVAIAALVLLAPLPAATAAAEDAAASAEAAVPRSWLPTDLGNRWSYVYSLERQRVTEGGEAATETFRGTRVDQVTAAADDVAPGAVEIRTTVHGRSESAVNDLAENRRVVVSSRGAGFRIHLREAPHPLTGETQVFRFDPPFEGMRPDVGRAEPWDSGVEQSGGLRTEYRTEVLGVQDAKTPAGLYEKCLVLRTQGVMSGSVEVNGETVDVDQGRVVVTEWFAAGVGRVLAKTEVEQKLRMEDGTGLELTEKSQYALGAVELAGDARPAAPPAAPAETSPPPVAPSP